MKSKNKVDRPSCACGKVDLYEEYIQMNEEPEKDSSTKNAVKNNLNQLSTRKKKK